MSIIKPGVKCRVVGGMNDDGNSYSLGVGPNMGKIVTVLSFTGEHPAIGNVWRCGSDPSNPIITFYGVVGVTADFPAGCLEPINPETIHDKSSRSIKLVA